MDNNAGRIEESGDADHKRKKRNMGRAEWSRQMVDKRARNDEQNETKRRKLENGEEVSAPIYATHFSQEDIESEQRRPKKKVAVLIGYAGTGYHGMQLSDKEKTIEGDLFAAFVAAGAISKANAADPKKSSLVRCARTDKGVHAAGNVVSLKLIVEDPDIVKKINEQLCPQIRVWDVQVTNKGFSCYQMCDSRVYEYLIPSYCFLPPHPSTYLGRKIVELAEKEGDLEGLKARQEEVATYWNDIDNERIKPILESLPDDIRKLVEKALYFDEEKAAESESADQKEEPQQTSGQTATAETDAEEEARRRRIYEAVKQVKTAYTEAKRAYRIPSIRLDRLQATLDKYIGTNNFYNYTIQKTHGDPSAKRYIKTFQVDRNSILINGTEWLSLKVHGQSFMMHQIRKMVAMATMLVRAGGDPARIVESYGPTKIAVPKAPGLGLLLERPIFDGYNKKATTTLGKDPIDFSKYEKEINEFKQREIYDRIFREEEQANAFSVFFNHIDHFSQETFLYVTSGGVAASAQPNPPTDGTEAEQKEVGQGTTKSRKEALAAVEAESDDEQANPNGEEGG
ncbi:pseudouridine synthase PUS2 [Aspergillus clavatus NRRL 1]|uniref:tRNA pseudouridine synthase 1 n=1 Tax=Aspergillus clavatus (strain ATCC 1007 / CBS 513.65 / DSM 816 / NCTC 3887 / NRRL 1 / QM 1276 / 107) TaxID=344612 RepID=A1CSQ9_ASPCL|nr:tRNA pseudouridine synthase, putative [Aspergillus clavatus NRRL 1]EAW06346.1 tRNA pseudouridine synthase, putative [Aspergillus clavatus NRRL 1]